MKTTIPETFNLTCDTLTLVRVFRKFSERPFVSPRLERVLGLIEQELELRASVALAAL